MPLTEHLSVEARIIQQAILGDKQAFGQLYEVYCDRIFKYLFFRIGSQEAAEDLMSTVFLKAWEALPNFGRYSYQINFRAWIYRIAHNTLIDFRRTKKDEISIESVGDLHSKSENPDREFERSEEVKKLIELLNSLDDLSKNVLINRFVAGLSHRDTANILGLKENNVRVIQYRAIKKLQEMTGEKNE